MIVQLVKAPPCAPPPEAAEFLTSRQLVNPHSYVPPPKLLLMVQLFKVLFAAPPPNCPAFAKSVQPLRIEASAPPP
jgi:hypothetical protein